MTGTLLDRLAEWSAQAEPEKSSELVPIWTFEALKAVPLLVQACRAAERVVSALDGSGLLFTTIKDELKPALEPLTRSSE